MRRRSNIMTASLTVISLAVVSGFGCSSGGGDSGACDALKNYTATVAGPLSFATDIYPILADTNTMNGCGQTGICHGDPPGGIDDPIAPTKFMQFLYNPPDIPMAKAQLLMASLNAPGMMRVVPGNVGASFMAYKISDRSTLACVNAMCVAGASAGNNVPCGDVMPSIGLALSPANRTKILDWIALGAAD